MTCSTRSARLSAPFELGVVRGADERTVTVGAADASAKGRTPGDA